MRMVRTGRIPQGWGVLVFYPPGTLAIPCEFYFIVHLAVFGTYRVRADPTAQ
jgi:hypothetical protein